MMRTSKFLALVVIAGSAAWLTGPAAAAPMSQPSTMQNAATPLVETAQFRRWGGGWRRWGPGIAAGAIIGGAIAGSSPWYGAYGNNYPYGYYGPPSAYAYDQGYYDQGYEAAPDSDDVAYCQQRYRSYDPSSGTYLGYDGLQHS